MWSLSRYHAAKLVLPVSRDARLQGFEFEYQQRLGHNLKIDTYLSHINAGFRLSRDKLPCVDVWLSNLGFLLKPVIDWTAAIQLHFVGKRHRSNLDPRSRLPASTSMDYTVSYLSSTPGLQLYLGVKNLSNEDIGYPQQLTTDFSEDVFLPCPDDYPRPGRRWWLSLSYDL
ncbi:MAG: TonB-dependent receptor [Candidatus Thiodiazotropha sp. (ex Ustalcina ferruginea)]|nr:TonB-dependent receptor [Candidatus Thiodiazotropha sp. (ex Ustalcina ferruginea)]